MGSRLLPWGSSFVLVYPYLYAVVNGFFETGRHSYKTDTAAGNRNTSDKFAYAGKREPVIYRKRGRVLCVKTPFSCPSPSSRPFSHWKMPAGAAGIPVVRKRRLFPANRRRNPARPAAAADAGNPLVVQKSEKRAVPASWGQSAAIFLILRPCAEHLYTPSEGGPPGFIRGLPSGLLYKHSPLASRPIIVYNRAYPIRKGWTSCADG